MLEWLYLRDKHKLTILAVNTSGETGFSYSPDFELGACQLIAEA